MGTKCEFIKKNGQPCMAYALADSRLCFWHSPDVLLPRHQAQQKGGRSRFAGRQGKGKTYSIRTTNDILEALEGSLNDISTLENSNSKSRTIGYLCQIALKGLEVSELEGRIRNLETRLGISGGK